MHAKPSLEDGLYIPDADEIDQAVDCYLAGLCPLGDALSPEDFVDWCQPSIAAGAKVGDLRAPRRLRKLARKGPFDVRVDTDFAGVVAACGTQRRGGQWITRAVMGMSLGLYEAGLAHSVECWRDDRLVGGLYGLAYNGLFIGESAFTRMDDAGSIAMVHLLARLRAGGFRFLDAQMPTEHVRRYGIGPIPQDNYTTERAFATLKPANWWAMDDDPDAALADFLSASAGTRPFGWHDDAAPVAEWPDPDDDTAPILTAD